MPSDLWHFAGQVYQQPGTENACLKLQAQGADVCLLLCGAWLGAQGVACSAERAQQLRTLSQPWQEQVVKGLRQLRQDWRAQAADDSALKQLREQVKQLELEAERCQLERLAVLSEAWPRGVQATTEQWLDELSKPYAVSDRDALHQLRDSALTLQRLSV